MHKTGAVLNARLLRAQAAPSAGPYRTDGSRVNGVLIRSGLHLAVTHGGLMVEVSVIISVSQMARRTQIGDTLYPLQIQNTTQTQPAKLQKRKPRLSIRKALKIYLLLVAALVAGLTKQLAVLIALDIRLRRFLITRNP